MKRNRTGLKWLALALALGLLAGCAGAAPAPESLPAESAPAPEAPAATFGMIVKERGNTYMQKMYEGFVMGCGELNVTPVLKAPDSTGVAAQQAAIEELVAEGVDAILIAANHEDDLQTALVAAMDAGILVLSIDSAVNPNSRLLHVQQADPEKIGRVLIQAAYAMVDGAGQAAIISSTAYATNQNLWLNWMHTELAENPETYANFTLIGDFYGQDDYATTAELVHELLDEHPDLSVIITPSSASMPAVGDVLAERGSDAKFTGLGLPSENADFILSGSCPWMYLWNPIELGYLAAYAAEALRAGEITGAEGDRFAAGSLGSRSIQTAADGGTEVVLANPLKFDPSNIELWRAVY